MKYLHFILSGPLLAFISILIIPKSIFGQQRTLAKFIITNATMNNVDVSDSYIKSNAYFVFYTKEDGLLYLANVMSKAGTQSYGRLQLVNADRNQETPETYKMDIFNFQWRYHNDYDGKSGNASIKIEKVYKPQGIVFGCTMITDELDVLTYKGYME